MGFLNILLLGGLAAFSIPLIIHILNKRRFQTVQWGAMHLLAPIVRKNNQRIRLEQLLLLLLRIAIPILLALCLARPILTGERRYDPDEKTSTVFLVDNSYSMQDGGAAQTNYARAKDEIALAMKELRKGSDTSVVFFGGRPRGLLDEPTAALDTVAREIRGTDSNADPIDIFEGLQAGLGEFDKMQHGARDFVVVSDFQTVDWKDGDSLSRRNAFEKVQEQKIAPSLTLLQLDEGPRENASLESIDVSHLILGIGQRTSIRANLKNHGNSSYPDLMVQFRVDGVEKRSSQITLGPSQEAQVRFTHTFDTPGSHTIEISTDADALRADNTFVASFPVWDNVPVLLVNGDPGNNPLEGETDFLALALQPFDAVSSDLNDLVTSRAIVDQQLNDTELKGRRVAILANVARLRDDQLRSLEKFVGDGGGLIVFPGDRIDLSHYNSSLFKRGKGLLPQQFTAFRGKNSGDARVSGSTRIVSQIYDHPALAFFNDPRNGKLNDAEFETWLSLGIVEDDRDKVGASLGKELTILARFESGDPFLVERAFGSGRVIQCAAPADADWGNLPIQPVFLPIMQRLVTYLAASVNPPTNLQVGAQLVAFVPVGQASQKAKLVDPAGITHELEIRKEGARGIVSFNETQRPGIYTLTDADGDTQHFAVNLDRREANLETLDEQAMESLVKEIENVASTEENQISVNVVGSWDEFQALDRIRRVGQELFKPILLALLAFLFLELLFQQWITTRVL